MTKSLKGIFGFGGNAADAVASWIAGDEEIAEGDFSAGRAMHLAAIGACIAAVGYVLGMSASWAIFGAILIGLGQLINVIGTIWFVLTDDKEITIWLRHSCFGTQRLLPEKRSTRWSEGSLTDFHHDVEKQVRALNAILFGFHVYWKDFPSGTLTPKPGSRHLVVSLKAMPPAAVVYVGLKERRNGATKELRPYGPVKDGFQAGSGADSSLRELWIEVPMRADELTAQVQIDIYGDGNMFYPARDPLVSKYSLSLTDLLVAPDMSLIKQP